MQLNKRIEVELFVLYVPIPLNPIPVAVAIVIARSVVGSVGVVVNVLKGAVLKDANLKNNN